MSGKLTGRIASTPARLLHDEVLEPQFQYEVEYLLPAYIQIELAMLLEYVRMGLITRQDALEIAKALQAAERGTVAPDPGRNMSDISFALERHVESLLSRPVPRWHIDRSRNDVQACAQVMFGRSQWLETADELGQLIRSIHRLAVRYRSVPMPGYTHYQSAQIITPGFYLSSINGEFVQTMTRWMHIYDEMNQCPLGAGAMAGLELPWNRQRLSKLLGFRQPRMSALAAVASREWVLRIAGELSTFSVLVSRFTTDLIQWGSSEMNFLHLPDDLSGISSAMPQKRNFPILERIRGKSAHLSAFYMDMVLGQRNTAFTNLVETSKEAGTHLLALFQQTRTLLRLLKTVTDHLQFNEERMLSICKRDFFGGFTLANQLTLEQGIPYRTAQVIAGRYIAAALEHGVSPNPGDARLLQEACAEAGFYVPDTARLLASSFDVLASLYGKKSTGSTHPEEVQQMLAAQMEQAERLELERQEREAQLLAVEARRERLLKGLLFNKKGKGVGLGAV
ncbi:lyase family protein [Paenibacillus thiaminolyticus]|uniref:argininosuccinate lyase n=1 Tax=Paenibacillus thiaminolyticus TaxID=49283 RepID=A0AAP9DT14_PANTH|nr:lyase family protein [Paenibacillus thiaminolyticus]MCY9538544.1 lyase family protein [Paenibacillus thiaminolyticus]MCY9600598.1 lyase family protein [Paenibacillus thiaminolyticus]MCY9608388.1 lyase family protein [Paenibacillus thiaminolyticus]MCY9614797.1 lyase family protein [Paenibacillus thiaminolyticus]MCY9619911.1 lyase family protein [Paenibacillus thiaminolyticus]